MGRTAAVRAVACVTSSAAAWLLLGGITAGQLLALVLAVWISTGGWRTLRIASRTLPRDLRAAVRFGYILYHMKRYERNNYSIIDLFSQTVKARPEKTAILFEEQRWTFKELDEYTNRVGNFFLSRGLVRGDCVAVFMENRPEYCGVWLGLVKIGVVPALINYNLRRAPLLHCIRASACKALIIGKELNAVVAEVQDELSSDLQLYSSGETDDSSVNISGSFDLDGSLITAPPSPPMLLDRLGFNDKLLYIYTSGTTGMPKAAIIKHSRFMYFSTGMFSMTGVRVSDRIYDPLPLYHSAGGMVGVGIVLIHGASVVIRRRFSASAYWTDVVHYNCTVSQYIGETCRYLLNQPEKPVDKMHQVRMMFGNGLRPQIWRDFQKRFNVPQICEFYGSTEGNANVINMEGRTGAVGFVPPLFPGVYPCLLIRVNETTGDPLRDDRGLCVPCQPGEPGEFVGMMVRGNSTRDFHGYADKSSTEKKIVTDVKKKGDKAFRSGDILVQDEDGYLYFMDRTGDTFRWKGENVSTTEVEGVIQRALDSSLAAVYGVSVPGAEGRAGMAALAVPQGHLDLHVLAEALEQQLPSYARPLFLRCVKQLDMTGTYKFKKVDLQKEGFDLDKVSDAMYFLDIKQSKFLPLTRDLYSTIVNGNLRL